ncbi:MAG: TIGR04282 family arsenosugar biosynthesis glycosyltransferase [Syntrophobacteraceae bacterium]
MNAAPRYAIIIFMRYPETGEVKSRLAVAVSPEEASAVYEKLVRRTLGTVAEVGQARPDTEVYVCFTPFDKEDDMRAAFPGPWKFFPQEGSHLGDRMDRAVRRVLSAGRPCRVVLAGTDLADIQAGDFHTALKILDSGQAVLGPARDGGFYLIGLDRPSPSAFRPESWGTACIFARTKELLEADGFSVQTLDCRRDVDRREDLAFFHSIPMFHQARLSVIIPTIRPIDRLLPLVRLLEAQLWPGDEIVIVRAGNGGPSDPVEVSAKTRCLISRRGRGKQMNRGALTARGDFFFFLHDDCLPPPNFAYHIRRTLLGTSPSLGCFHLAFSPSTPVLDLIAKWADTRTRLLHLPYGDQGLFCSRETFFAIGGFLREYLMEDVDFVSRCLRIGRLECLPFVMQASSRKYLNGGILRTSLKNHLLMLLYHLGVSDRKLYFLYYGFPPDFNS